jgi:hypothetical protein
VPAGVTTTTFTAPAVPAGAAQVIWESLTTVKLVPGVAPKRQAEAAKKPHPVSVVLVPPVWEPVFGEMLWTLGWRQAPAVACRLAVVVSGMEGMSRPVVACPAGLEDQTVEETTLGVGYACAASWLEGNSRTSRKLGPFGPPYSSAMVPTRLACVGRPRSEAAGRLSAASEL